MTSLGVRKCNFPLKRQGMLQQELDPFVQFLDFLEHDEL